MSRETQDTLTEDTLFLACTRPAMVLGVPMEAVGVNVIASATVFLAAHSLLCLLIAPVLHLVFSAICRSDPNAFRLLWAFLNTQTRARNAALWGGSSSTPLALGRRQGTAFRG